MKKLLGAVLLLIYGCMQASDHGRKPQGPSLPKKTLGYIGRRQREVAPPHMYHQRAIDYLESMENSPDSIKTKLLACSGGSMEFFVASFTAKYGYDVKTQAVVPTAAAGKQEPAAFPANTIKKKRELGAPVATCTVACEDNSDTKDGKTSTRRHCPAIRYMPREEMMAAHTRAEEEMDRLGSVFSFCERAAKQRGCSVDKALTAYTRSDIVIL